MIDLFLSVIPGYDSLDETEVNKEQWDDIKNQAKAIGGNLFEAIEEADIWVQETFLSHMVFTIIGI